MIEPSSCVERFLRYVTFDTQSSGTSGTYPSTAGQLDLLRHLVEELRAIGLATDLDEYGYVMATIPETTSKTNVPVIGFIAHVDTSPETSGAGVKPIVHRNYQGQDLVLPDDPTAVLRAADYPYLRERIGDDIITASGTTLLGADDKAGVAEIVAAAEYLMAHPEIPGQVPAPLRLALAEALLEIRDFEERAQAAEKQLEALAAQTPVVARLRSIPGIGLLTATALVAFVGDIERFPTSRHFASFLGLTPRERSSGQTRRLGAISKRGHVYLRTLLIHGARAVLLAAKRIQEPDRLRAWALHVEQQRGHNKATVALANKIARIVWAVWKSGAPYETRLAV